MSQESKPEHRHPIKVVARRTGLTPDVLRVWEKRYGAVSPTRVDTATARDARTKKNLATPARRRPTTVPARAGGAPTRG